MDLRHIWPSLAVVGALCLTACAKAQSQPAAPTSAEILAAAPAADWRPIDAAQTLYMDLPGGRVVIELAPGFAPLHLANLKLLVRAGYFDGLAIERAQDDYVVQWGDADGKRPLGAAKSALPPEFSRPTVPGEAFAALADPDTYAPQSGFAAGFPVARDPARGETWLTHCYGMVGVGRDNDAASGSGAELYAVIGNAPRQLDRNVTLIGKVVQGMELLSVMPRGTGDLGFYKTPAERTPIRAIRVAADLPLDQRARLEELRTDSPTFAAWLTSKRTRSGPWFKDPVGRLDVCNAAVPVRAAH